MNRMLSPWRGNLASPFSMFKREMDDLVERFFRSNTDQALQMGACTDVAESDDAYEVSLEMPGLKAEDVNVEIKDGALWVSGEKKEETEKKGKTFLRVERRYGRFRHVIPLAQAVNPDNVTAEYQNGVLKVTVAKSEAAKPKRIPVRGPTAAPPAQDSASL